MEERARKKMKPSSASQAERYGREFILPKLGQSKVPHISRTDIVELQADMAGIPNQANSARSLLNPAFDMAEVWAWRPEASNTCRRVKLFKLAARERFLSDDRVGPPRVSALT